MNQRPDFFILGAPKCGTSALDQYLAEHAAIQMAEKETSFLSSDFPGHQIVKTWDEYWAQFTRQKATAHIWGEGTFCYLYSQVAAKRIHELNPDARLIAMLRNPVELAYSFHSQLRYNGEETENFERALELEPARREGLHIPSACQTAAMLQYRAVSRLGEQVARVYRYFPPEQVLLILFDDFRRDTRGVYQRVLEFLGVEDDGRSEFPVVNQNKRHKSATVGRFTEQPPRQLKSAVDAVKRVLGIRSLGVLQALRRFNVQEAPREPLADALRARLAEEFYDDVRELSAYVGRDLTRWFDVAPTEQQAVEQAAPLNSDLPVLVGDDRSHH